MAARPTLATCYVVKSVYLCSLPAVSVVMKGEQMVPVLNSLDIQCAVYGNHDFGRGDFPSVIIMYTIAFLWSWHV